MKRAAYQVDHCWAQATIVTPELSSPSECGWKRMLMGGIFAGLPCQKPQKHKFHVVARRIAGGTVSAERLN